MGEGYCRPRLTIFWLSFLVSVLVARMPFFPDRFTRCSTVGVSQAKVVYSAFHSYYPPPSRNQLEAREGHIHHVQLGPALNLWARMELFHLPTLPPYLFPNSPSFPPKRTKKAPPKFHSYAEVTHRQREPERGSLFPARKHFLHSWPSPLFGDVVKRKQNNKNKRYDILRL